ncbi:MAG: DUF4250 domain-containing protein [Gammaproteobacteria bacterium HGW-Gammaproteobacteria-1]|jgi:hypothetical protein|nr:MAG: DUF4250 domain-containing protein [Gammaproteobacteria bacterium HGW-Gammaproteobacteria-1]
MKLPTDPHLLYSLVNMKLRNDYADLDDLVRSLEVERTELERRMAEAGYRYEPAINQFRHAPADDAG